MPLPPALADWPEAPRVRPLNDRPIGRDGAYVLCWLQQALRADDNPVIDAAIRLANAQHLPALVYQGVREDYPHASDRLHHFLLGAGADLATGCRARGVACVQHVDREGSRERGLVHRLGAGAAAIVVEDQPAFVARAQAATVAARAPVAVYAVNAACLVPPAVLGDRIKGRFAFLKRHEPEREAWNDSTSETPDVAPYAGPLPFVPDALEDIDREAMIAGLAIDHSLPRVDWCPPTATAAAAQVDRLVRQVLPHYAARRNDATDPSGASMLSPWLHFGMIGPRRVMQAVRSAQAGRDHKAKFADELLGWREWFHHQSRELAVPERYDRVAASARATLADHAHDPRPALETLGAMLHGETRDETWNACQRQFLIDGWMHNNLRMYWAKRIIAMTPDPQTAWATACYLNDRLSLDGRDPATYGNIAAMFGGATAEREANVYGFVAQRGDGSTRHRPGGDAWITQTATRPVPRVGVPDAVPTRPYLE